MRITPTEQMVAILLSLHLLVLVVNEQLYFQVQLQNDEIVEVEVLHDEALQLVVLDELEIQPTVVLVYHLISVQLVEQEQ